MADVFELSGFLGDLTGDFEGYEITGVFLESTEQALTDVDTGTIHVASGKQMVVDAATGAASLTGIPSSVDASWRPGGQQYRLAVYFVHHQTGQERRWRSGWFPIDGDKTFADLQMGTPTVVNSEVYESVLTARDEAVEARDQAVEISGIDDVDGAIDNLLPDKIEDPTSAVGLALLATIGQRVTPALGSMQRLMAGIHAGEEDQNVLHIGTSTGNEAGEWIRQLWLAVAAQWPAVTFVYRLINDGAGTYGTETLQTGTGPRTVTIYNCSVAGATTRYFQGAKFATHIASLAAVAPVAGLISLTHNEGSVPNLWLGQQTAFVEEVALALPGMSISIVQENPVTANTLQQQRAAVYREYAASRGFGWFDICQAFLDSGVPLANLLLDGIHPNATGTALWVQTMLPAFRYVPEVAPRTQTSPALEGASPEILVNGDFSDFGGALPTGWLASGTATAAKNTTNFESPNGYSVDVTSAAAGDNLYKNLPAKLVLGRWVTLTVRQRVAAGQDVTAGRIALADSLGTTTSQAESYGRDGFRYVVVSRFIAANATVPKVILYGASAGGGGVTAYDFASIRIGKLPGRGGTGARGLQGPAGVVAGQIDFMSSVGGLGPFLYASSLSTGMAIANDAVLVEFRPSRDVSVNELVWFTGATSAGNYDIGIYDASGNRLWAKGSAAWPAANSRVAETISSPIALTAGTKYYLAIASDGTTGLFRGVPETFTNHIRNVTGGFLSLRVGSAFPLPSSLAPGSTRGGKYPAISVHGT
ncbi:SGNH/GDSL hydrolase family protein [Nocardioides lijunqiniae]|uniref:SGNH/GDSL hydrolase family protein n=1 Tax=Nocardioides lijunqiniae TaxID=2760832 RepID=UPI001878A2B0|nr:SGNH/GDSL hydrolase family protein [Nocardioides lijunqiniae]